MQWHPDAADEALKQNQYTMLTTARTLSAVRPAATGAGGHTYGSLEVLGTDCFSRLRLGMFREHKRSTGLASDKLLAKGNLSKQ